MKSSFSETMSRIVSTVINLVTSNDDLIGTTEGLECLILQGLWQANAGNLRRAWLSYRRALSLGQLLGVDRGCSQALKSADPSLDPSKQAPPENLWYRIVFCDRYFSLVLGLPIGASDNSFASEEAMARDTPMEKLEKIHTVIAARIADRNSSKASQPYSITQAIDYDLETAARDMDPEWWAEPPPLDPFCSSGQVMITKIQLNLQIHHFSLLVLLHLPYMLRDPADSRYEHSRTTCVRSSREVLRRFVLFRSLINSVFSCRHVDYAGLIAAMTLQLSYLGCARSPQLPVDAARAAQAQEDRRLVEVVRERMEHVAILNHDNLSRESADIVGKLMVVLDAVGSDGAALSESRSAMLNHLQLAIPYLGTISIHPNGASMPAVDTAASRGEPLPVTAVAQPPPNTGTPQSPLGAGDHVPEQPMDFGDIAQLSEETEGVIAGMYMELEPQDPDTALFPCLMAENDEWAFQGVDTTYWSLLNSEMGSG